MSVVGGDEEKSAAWNYQQKAYNEKCHQIDEYMCVAATCLDSSYDNDDLVVVFSIGNDGESGYNQVPAPALAKNVIAVGATGVTGYGTVEDENYVPYYSSRGPSCSRLPPPSPIAGRIKPDLVSAGVAHAAKAFTTTACNNECQDHTDTKVASGTYPPCLPRLFFTTGRLPRLPSLPPQPSARSISTAASMTVFEAISTDA